MVKWITVEEAAATLGYKPAWIRRLASRGYIKAKKFGRDWQVDKKALANFTPPKRTGRPPTNEGS